MPLKGNSVLVMKPDAGRVAAPASAHYENATYRSLTLFARSPLAPALWSPSTCGARVARLILTKADASQTPGFERSAAVVLLAGGLWALTAAWAAYWCVLMLETCWQLVIKDGGPGPFGLLIFPFWAAVAIVPALILLGLLRVLRGRHR